MSSYLSPKNAASELNVTPGTLRRWATEGKIDFIQSPSGHRRYDVTSYISAAKTPQGRTSGRNRDRHPLFTVSEYNAPLRPDYFRKERYFLPQNFERSLSDLDRIPLEKLRKFARSIPARRAIHKICNGIVAMKWNVHPKDSSLDATPNKKQIDLLTTSFKRPNNEETKTYSALIKVLVTDIVVCGFAAIERQLGDYDDESKRLFRLWPINAANIRPNPDWRYQDRKTIFRYYDTGGRHEIEEWRGLYDDEVIILQQDYCSWEQIPASTLEVAYNFVEIWLGVSDQQRRVTSKGVRRTILSLGEKISNPELSAFREYWETEIEGTGEMPIMGGSPSVVDLGAKNDEELYLKYVDYLIRIIALAFDMTNRDFNLTETDNRATAGVAADATFLDCILPFAILFEETWNLEILEHYPEFEEYVFELFDKEPRNEMEEGTLAWTLWEKQVTTLNETRLRVGLDPIKEGSIFFGGKTADQLAAPEALPPGQELPGQPNPGGAIPAAPAQGQLPEQKTPVQGKIPGAKDNKKLPSAKEKEAVTTK